MTSTYQQHRLKEYGEVVAGRNVENLLVAGRAVAGDRVSHAAMRSSALTSIILLAGSNLQIFSCAVFTGRTSSRNFCDSCREFLLSVRQDHSHGYSPTTKLPNVIASAFVHFPVPSWHHVLCQLHERAQCVEILLQEYDGMHRDWPGCRSAKIQKARLGSHTLQ